MTSKFEYQLVHLDSIYIIGYPEGVYFLLKIDHFTRTIISIQQIN